MNQFQRNNIKWRINIMKKRSIVSMACVVLTVVMMLSLFVGCGSTANNTASTQSEQAATTSLATTTPAAKQNVTITLAASQNFIKDIDKALAEKFKTETTNSVDIQVSPDDQYPNVVKTKLASGDGPDIYMCPTGLQMDVYFPDKYAADLSNEPWVSQITDFMKPGVTKDGKVVSMSIWGADGWGLMYDSQLLTKYGIKAPTTYTEFTAACDTLKKNGITPLYGIGKATWWLNGWLTANGGAIEKNNVGTFDMMNKGEIKLGVVPEIMTALKNFKELNDKGYFQKDWVAQDWGQADAAMASGKYGFVFAYTAFANEIVTKTPSAGPVEKWLMVPNPIYDNMKVWEIGTGVGHIANKDSKNLDVVKDYFNFLTKPENLQAFYTARADLAASTFKTAKGNETAALTSVMAQATDGIFPSIGDSVSYLNGGLAGQDIQGLMLGSKTPEQVLADIDNDRAKTVGAISSAK